MMCTADGAGCALAAPGAGFASVARRAAGRPRPRRVPELPGRRRPRRPRPRRGPGAARGDHLPARRRRQRAAAAVRRRRRPRRRRVRHQPPPGSPPGPTSAARTPRPPSARCACWAGTRSLDAATATGAVTISWAREIAGWTGRIDHDELQSEADQILVDAAAAGADLDDLKLIAQAAYEAWRAQEPDPDDDPAGRGLRRPVPAASRPPWTAPGGSRGRPDPRVRRRRHRGPGGARQKPRPGGHAHRRAALPRRPPGGLRAAHPRQDGPRPGRRRHPRRRHHPPPRPPGAWTAPPSSRTPGSAPGPASTGTCPAKDAEAIACDALIVPVVTGSPDWDAHRRR